MTTTATVTMKRPAKHLDDDDASVEDFLSGNLSRKLQKYNNDNDNTHGLDCDEEKKKNNNITQIITTEEVDLNTFVVAVVPSRVEHRVFSVVDIVAHILQYLPWRDVLLRARLVSQSFHKAGHTKRGLLGSKYLFDDVHRGPDQMEYLEDFFTTVPLNFRALTNSLFVRTNSRMCVRVALDAFPNITKLVVCLDLFGTTDSIRPLRVDTFFHLPPKLTSLTMLSDTCSIRLNACYVHLTHLGVSRGCFIEPTAIQVLVKSLRSVTIFDDDVRNQRHPREYRASNFTLLLGGDKLERVVLPYDVLSKLTLSRFGVLMRDLTLYSSKATQTFTVPSVVQLVLVWSVQRVTFVGRSIADRYIAGASWPETLSSPVIITTTHLKVVFAEGANHHVTHLWTNRSTDDMDAHDISCRSLRIPHSVRVLSVSGLEFSMPYALHSKLTHILICGNNTGFLSAKAASLICSELRTYATLSPGTKIAIAQTCPKLLAYASWMKKQMYKGVEWRGFESDEAEWGFVSSRAFTHSVSEAIMRLNQAYTVASSLTENDERDTLVPREEEEEKEEEVEDESEEEEEDEGGNYASI